MNTISLFPEFEEVFAEDSLKGIFYPVCKIVSAEYPYPLYIVSSNGLWFDEHFKSNQNTETFTLFEVMNDGKYAFSGDYYLYKNASEAQAIFPFLEEDFQKNGEKYLSWEAENYLEEIKPLLQIEDEAFDVDYYLETFFYYSKSKLTYQKTGSLVYFEAGRKIYFEGLTQYANSYGDVEVNAEYLFPEEIDLQDFKLIGAILGYQFFNDGNDVTLLHHLSERKVLLVNSYS